MGSVQDVHTVLGDSEECLLFISSAVVLLLFFELSQRFSMSVRLLWSRQ